MPPQYFFHDVAENKKGPKAVEDVLKSSLVFIPPKDFLAKIAKTAGAAIIDSRSGSLFEKGHIANSLNIPLQTNFAVWVGGLVNALTPIFIVAEAGKERETIVRLARIGYDNVQGCLDGGFEAFIQSENEAKLVQSISSADVTHDMFVIDVRNIGEYKSGSLQGALNIPLNEIEATLKKNPEIIPKDKPVYAHCKSGVRSLIACSIL